MLLTEQEIKLIGEGNTGTWQDDLQFARAIESAVLEKLKAQEPVGYMNKLIADQSMWNFDTQSYADENWLSTPLYEHPDPRVAELEAVLREIRSVAPREVECHNMHHAKKDRHEFDETCQVVIRYAEAIAKIDEVLNG